MGDWHRPLQTAENGTHLCWIPEHPLRSLRAFANFRPFKSKKEWGISVGHFCGAWDQFCQGPSSLLTPRGFAISLLFSLSSHPLSVDVN